MREDGESTKRNAKNMNDVFRDFTMVRNLQEFFAQKEKRELAEKIAGLSGFSDDRKELLLDILKSNIKIDMPDSLDVLLFAAQVLYPEAKIQFDVKETIYSKNDLYEYDPKKNGCNIIKHGISFREAASSELFGTLMVPIDYVNDPRHVIFSTISKSKLSYPCKGFRTEDFIIASISANESEAGGIRFVSAKKISTKSGKKFKEDLMNMLRTIYPNQKDKREEFVVICIDRLKESMRELLPKGV